MIQIEKNIPIPENARRGRPSYPWADMDIGDSFFVPSVTKKSAKSTCRHASLRHEPMKFICHDVEGGVRAWRIA